MPENNLPVPPIDLSTGPTTDTPEIDKAEIPAPSRVDFQPIERAAGVVSDQPKNYLNMDLSDIMDQFKNPDKGKVFNNPIVTPEPITRKYGDKYNPFEDNEENFAQNQPWYHKWGNALAKAGITTIGTFAENMMAIPDIISGVKSGDPLGAYKNSAAQAIDNWVQNSENTFPNYYTHWEQDHPFMSALPFSGGFANFWGDQFTKNIGFTVGAIGGAAVQDLAIGAVTEGLGELPMLANQVGKASLWLNKILTGTNRLEEAMQTAALLGKSEEFMGGLQGLARAAQATKVGRGLEYGTALYTAAHAEAGIEARQGYEKVKQDLTDQFYKDHGYYPLPEDQAKIEQIASDSGNARYGLNLAILGLSDAIQFEHILKPWNSYKQSLLRGVEGTTTEQLGKVGVKGEIKTAEDISKLEMVDQPGSRLGKIWNAFKPTIPNILAEGPFEEGGQYAIQMGTQKYYEDKYQHPEKSKLDDVINSTIYGLGEQFGTTEGLQNMFLGGLTGALMAPITHRIENFQQKKAGVLDAKTATTAAIQDLNRIGPTGLFENNYSNAAQNIKTADELNKAVQSKNIFAFKNLKDDSFYNFIDTGIKNNRFEVRKEQLKMLKELPNEEINKLFNITDGTPRDNHAYIDQMISMADQIKKIHDSHANMMDNPYQYKGDPKSEEDIKQNESWKAFEDHRSALGKMAYRALAFNARLEDIQKSLGEIHPLLTNELAANLTDPKFLSNLKVEYKEQAESLQKSIDENLISRSRDVKLYGETKDQITALLTHYNNISKLLTADGDENVKEQTKKVVPELAQFELNGRDPNGKQEINPIHTEDLINKGFDINQIEYAKLIAKETYKHLLTSDGFADFMKDHQTWVNGLSLNEKPTEVSDLGKQIKIGNDSFEIGRQYKTAIKDRFTVSPVTEGDITHWRLKDAQGNLVDTFKDKDTAYAERDKENDNIEKNLDKVTIIGQEGSKIIVEDSSGQIQKIHPSFLSKAEKSMSEEEIVDEKKDFFDDLDKNTDAEDKSTDPDFASGEPEKPEYFANYGEREEPKKDKEIVNQSTTFNPQSTEAYYQRQKAFFSKIDLMPDEIRQNARVIYVHENNQKALGLDGIIDPQFIDKDPAKTLLLAVFVKQEGDSFKFLTADGKETTNKDELVYATMPVSNEDPIRWRNTTSMSFIKADNGNWNSVRAQILKDSSASPMMYNFNVSRGFAERDFRGDKLNYNPVTDVLLHKSDLDNGIVLTVSDGQVVHQGNLLDIQAGKLLVQNGNTLEALENRKFNPKESENIYEVLKHMVENSVDYSAKHPTLDKEILEYLKGVMYWRVPKTGVAIGASQSYIRGGYVFIAGQKFPFTVKSFEDNKLAITNAIEGAYVNANNKYLKDNLPFRELSVENGKLKSNTWESYQHYLVSNTNSDGSKRDIDDIPFKTSIRPINTQVANDSNFIGKYAIITGNIVNGERMYTTVEPKQKANKVVPKVKEVKEVKKEEKTRNGLFFNGETKNKFPTNNGNITFGVTEVNGQNQFSIIQDKAYEDYIKDLLTNPTDYFQQNLEFWEHKGPATEAEANAFLLLELDNYVTEIVTGTLPNFETKESKEVKSIASEEKLEKKVEEEKPAVVETKKPSEVIKPDGTKPRFDVDEISDAEAFRKEVSSTDNYVVHNLEQSLEWFKANIPVEYEIMERLIRTTDGGYAWGRYYNNVVSFYRNAERGTIEHEGFEAIWGDYLSIPEKKGLLAEFNSRKGSFIDRETGEQVSYNKADEHQAKEELAEELGRYVLDGTLVTQPKEGGNRIFRFFRNIIQHIKNLIFGKDKITKLFEKINAGYYKGQARVSQSNKEEYRIKNLTEADSAAIIRGMTYLTVGEIFKNNRSLIEFDSANQRSISDLYDNVKREMEQLYTVNTLNAFKAGKISEDDYKGYLRVWEAVKADNENVNTLLKEFLRTVNVVADLSGQQLDNVLEDNKELNEKEGDQTEYAGRKDDSYAIDQWRIDAKRSASNSVKLLMITLADTNYIDPNNPALGTRPKRDRGTLMPVMANYHKTFDFLLNQLSGFNTWQEKANKMQELAKIYPNYKALNKRLKLGESFVDADTWTLRNKFFNTMSKQKPRAYTQFIDKKKSTASQSSITTAFADKAQEWLDSIKLEADEKNPNKLIKLNEEGKYYFDGSPLKNKRLNTIQNQFDFLDALNVPFTEELYKKLSSADQGKFTEAVKGLYKELSNKKGVIDITSGSLGSAGNFNRLAALYFQATEDISSTRYNISGQKQQQFIGNNFISLSINDINNSKSKQDFYNRLPYMNDGYREDSCYIKDILFSKSGQRTDKRLEIGVNDGIVDDKYEDPITIAKMSSAARLMAEINMNLIGNYYIFVPADSKTEWMLKMQHIIPFKNFYQGDIRDQIYNVFNGYYQTEKNIAATTPNYKSTMWNEAYNTDYKADNLDKKKFHDYLDENVLNVIKTLQTSGVIEWHASRNNKSEYYTLKSLNSDFVTESQLGVQTERDERTKPVNRRYSKADLLRLFTFTEVNYMINNIEMQKLFFGDLNNIKDPLKRYKSFISPRETAIYDTPQYNKSRNESRNKAGNITLTKEDPYYWEYKDHVPTITLQDIQSSESRTDLGKFVSVVNDGSFMDKTINGSYEKTNPVDGQSYAFLPAYREILDKNGGRWSSEQEELFQYISAADRQLMLQDGVLTEENYREELRKHDEEVVNKGYSGKATLHILKPIGSGVDLNGNLFLDKTSFTPLTYAFVRNSPAMRQLYLQMMEQKIGYAIYESGRKLGAGENMHELYTRNGKINQNKFQNIINVPHKYLGIQVETQGEHDNGTMGSQLTKLAVANLRDAGYALSPEIQTKIDRHNLALQNLTNYGYRALLNKLGIVDEGGLHFSVPDKSKIVSLLRNELFKREAPQNLKDAITLDENGDFKVPFESLANYQQIKDILYSFVDKMITKPKLNGGPKIQMSGTGFEVDGRTITKTKINGKDALVSNGLKFYAAEYNKEGKRTSVARMEVMIPIYFYNKIKDHPRWKGKSEDEVLDYLNSTAEGKEILNGIGFRIPTQESNSVEAFTVKSFLPSYLGDTIVLPESITTKSGGDFDVDKLNTYLKNVYIEDVTGDIKVVPYGPGFTSRNAFKDLDVWKGYQTEEDLMADLLDLDSDIAKDRNPINELFRQSLQNEYFASLEDLILLPENYDRLIRPNSAQKGKDLRDKLVKLAPEEFGVSKDKSLNNRMYMSTMRHLFLTGKTWVGISASSQTNNAVNQSARVILNKERIKDLPSYQRNILSLNNGALLLNHNGTQVNGDNYATLSKMRDTAGEYISDKISRYIDGPVDIAKDSWVTQLFQNTKMFSTSLLMQKLGIKDETVVMFLNQPIIREYIKTLENNNTRWLYNESNYKSVFRLFGLKPIEFKQNSLLNAPRFKNIEEDKLASNIEKYYNGGKLTIEENERQKTIFYEFLKYSILADQLFDFQRSTSYDTSASPDPIQQLRKSDLLDRVKAENVFTDVEDVFKNTQLGTVRDRVQNASSAIEQSYSLFNNEAIKSNLIKVLRQLPKFNIDYEKAARNVEASYLTYMVQTNTGINTQIKELMQDPEKSVAARLWKVKSWLYKNAKNTDIAKNAALKELVSIVKNKKTDIKNINFVHKATESFTADVYTNAFRELRDSGAVVNGISIADLYKDIVTLSMLQSGYQSSKLSFTKYLPYEDVTAMTKDLLTHIGTAPNINEFAQNGTFFRNNWKNKEIVPSLSEQFDTNKIELPVPPSKYRLGNGKQGRFYDLFDVLKKQNGIQDTNYRLYKLDTRSSRASNSFITMQTWNNYNEMLLETPPKPLLMQRLEYEDGNPIFIPYNPEDENGHYIYVPINPLGDGQYLQEHYTDIRPSVVKDVYKFSREISPSEIIKGLGLGESKDLDMSEKSAIFAEKEANADIPMQYTPENIEKLEPNQVFVFGSNAEGVHGKGAALLAKQRFGAKQGQAEGLQGQSYAVVTKKNWRVEKSSTLGEIKDGLEKMLNFATNHPEKQFLVTKLGSSLAGYTISEIKGLFDELRSSIPNNVILPKEYSQIEQKQSAQMYKPLDKFNGRRIINTAYRTMQFGDLEGKLEAPLRDHINDMIVNFPAQKIGNVGESWNHFEARVLTEFKKDIRERKGNTVIVTHSSVLKLLLLWNKLGRPDVLTKENRQEYTTMHTQPGEVNEFKGDKGTIYVARHGQTEDNLLKNLRGPNTQLTAKGIEEALEVGKKLANIKIDNLETSPFNRTIHTSDIILSQQKGEVTPTTTEKQQYEEDIKSLKEEFSPITESMEDWIDRMNYTFTDIPASITPEQVAKMKDAENELSQYDVPLTSKNYEHAMDLDGKYGPEVLENGMDIFTDDGDTFHDLETKFADEKHDAINDILSVVPEFFYEDVMKEDAEKLTPEFLLNYARTEMDNLSEEHKQQVEEMLSDFGLLKWVNYSPNQLSLFDENKVAPEGKPQIDITDENNCPF